MRTFTKSLIVASVVGTVGLGGLATATVAGAESGESSGGPMSGLIDKIASSFNIDKAKLQTLFDEERDARDAEREQQLAKRLQALVDNGTITAAQKTAIESKLAEIKKERTAEREAMKRLTKDERKAKLEAKKVELEAWAKAQGLDLSKLRGVFGGRVDAAGQ